ncbi:hypothetical protein D0Z07_8479 [Hyphodiscus hymeniophilus]|uniref:DUF8004 domain-containing protein n=1 Tax=Hyphodiscus hymeniophilus TaxID=353542 RepID=A0A9P6VD86_9HELO|nr:hypothetical protein D0Z07_8479 [Hyphodiscus hymeniophilus]
MSGRSAYVRKVKEHGKTGEGGLEHSPTIIGEFPMPDGQQFGYDTPVRQNTDHSTIKSGSSGLDPLASHGAYQRVQKAHAPVIVDSGIEKSIFRSLMDKRSDGARKVLSKTFGKKKKENDSRPATSSTIRPDDLDMAADDYSTPPPPVPSSEPQQLNRTPEYIRPGPPSSELPPIPQGPQLKRWPGAGQPPHAWNKLRKDPELWDIEGDTLIYLVHENHQGSRHPSLRVSSHILEDTDSQYLFNLLQQGSMDEAFGMPPSPSPGMRTGYLAHAGRHQLTPPMSENSSGAYDGQISYEITIAPPLNQTKTEAIRHQVATRNVFAMLYKAPLVGTNLFQALHDLQERLDNWFPPDTDTAGMIIDWLLHKGMEDVRNNPPLAASILAWSELSCVRWEEGWKEAYIHSIGMYPRMQSTADFRTISPITKALIERGNLEIQVRILNCEVRFNDFDFSDMWPPMLSPPPPSQLSFERVRRFFCLFYADAFGTWPPAAPTGEEQWLTRTVIAKLQKDFGALYDYLVNREVTWDCSEERSGRKWNMIHSGNRSFRADTFDLPFTDLLIAFDNRFKYPHIPHPYPLVPESIPVKTSKEKLLRTPRKQGKTEDKMAERRAALAYSESTNIFLMGSDFQNNDLVEAFIKYEKVDRAADVDPHDARRGRWILIYGILQTLASISVDVPGIRYSDGVSYHLNPRVKGTPPWRGAKQSVEAAQHNNSFCWTVQENWHGEKTAEITRPRNPMASALTESTFQTHGSLSASSLSFDDETIQGSDAGSSVRAPFSVASFKSRSTRRGRRQTNESDLTTTSSGYGPSILHSEDSRFGPVLGRGPVVVNTPNDSGYGPGIEKVEDMEWPMREDSRATSQKDITKKSSLSMNDIGHKASEESFQK